MKNNQVVNNFLLGHFNRDRSRRIDPKAPGGASLNRGEGSGSGSGSGFIEGGDVSGYVPDGKPLSSDEGLNKGHGAEAGLLPGS